MNNINSLYTFIKEQKEKKGRPLKIVVDWDDCIQPFWPWIVFQASPDKDNWDKFNDYFKEYFWKGSTNNKEVAEFVQKAKKEKLVGTYYDWFRKTYGNRERYKAPLTTIAEDLLKALKENLVEDLLVISSFTYEGEDDPAVGKKRKNPLQTCRGGNGKAEKFFKTFGKFPEATFELLELRKNKEGKHVPRRVKRINLLLPDFDIFIDDKKNLINEAVEGLAEKKDKSYLLTDYEDNKDVEAPNIYKIKVGISDIKNSDFVFKKPVTPKQKKGDDYWGENTESPWDNEDISLYDLIKQKSQQEGKKLKIICDWDECLQPFNPKIWYELIKEKGWRGEEEPDNFKDYFKFFWENASMEFFPYQKTTNTCNKVIEELRKDPEKFQKEVREPFFKIAGSPDFYKNSPLLSIADDLLKALKEDLISELVLFSSYRKGDFNKENQGKKDVFKKTFGQFPNASISIYEVGKDEQGNNVPLRKDWVNKNHPDFDICIDDNNHFISSASKKFSSDKTFVLPDYDYSRHLQTPNICHVKTTVSDLKSEDFAKAAKEYKDKKAKQLREKATKRERESNYLLNYRGWDSDFGVGNFVSYY